MGGGRRQPSQPLNIDEHNQNQACRGRKGFIRAFGPSGAMSICTDKNKRHLLMWASQFPVPARKLQATLVSVVPRADNELEGRLCSQGALIDNLKKRYLKAVRGPMARTRWKRSETTKKRAEALFYRLVILRKSWRIS